MSAPPNYPTPSAGLPPAGFPSAAQYPPAYPAPPAYGASPVRPDAVVTNRRNYLGIIALICGVVSTMMLVSMGSGQLDRLASDGQIAGYLLLWIAVGVTSIVLAVMGLRAAGRRQATNRAMSISGLVLGIVNCSLLLLVVILAAGTNY